MKDEELPKIVIATDELGFPHWEHWIILSFIKSEVIIIECKHSVWILDRLVRRWTKEYIAAIEEKREKCGDGYRVWLRRLPAIDVVKQNKDKD